MLNDSVQDSRTCFDFFAKKGRCFLGRFDSRRFGREPSWARFLASSRKFAALRSWEMQLDSVVRWHLKLNTGIMLVTCNYATALHGIFKQRAFQFFAEAENDHGITVWNPPGKSSEAKWVIGWAMVGSHLSHRCCFYLEEIQLMATPFLFF